MHVQEINFEDLLKKFTPDNNLGIKEILWGQFLNGQIPYWDNEIPYDEIFSIIKELQ